MKEINFNTESGHKKYNILDRMYHRLINETIRKNEGDEERWETYDIIMKELKKEYDYNQYDEIKYRLTDGENPNEVFYDIINRGEYSSGLIWIMKRRIKEWIEEDSYRRFLE